MTASGRMEKPMGKAIFQIMTVSIEFFQIMIASIGFFSDYLMIAIIVVFSDNGINHTLSSEKSKKQNLPPTSPPQKKNQVHRNVGGGLQARDGRGDMASRQIGVQGQLPVREEARAREVHVAGWELL